MNNEKKLLLIENDLTGRASSFTHFLRNQNVPYDLTSTASLTEAEKYLLTESVDLILLDSLVDIERDVDIICFFHQTPVILIAENSEEESCLKMMRRGVDEYLIRDQEGKYCALLSTTIEKVLARRVFLKQERSISQKNEPLQRLTAALAHDLSNMLSPILGFSKILIDETESTTPHFELIEEIHRSAVRAKNLVRQLSIFREKDVSKFAQINLTDALQDFSKVLQSTLSDNVSLDVQLEKFMPPILGDIALVEQAVMNLCLFLQDSIRHTGKVGVSLAKMRGDDLKKQKIETTCETYLALRARATTHTGEDEQAETASPRHPQHHTEAGGNIAADPGLELVRAIVKQHNGFIRVESDPNMNAVTLFFPVSDHPLPEVDRPEKDKTKKQGCESILLVESNLQLNKLISTVLQYRGYTIHSTAKEEKAYELAIQGEEKVDLLLADTTLVEPGNNRIFITLTKNNRAIQSLYMATPGCQELSAALKPWGEEQLIYKPFALNQLAERVRRALDNGDYRERRFK